MQRRDLLRLGALASWQQEEIETSGFRPVVGGSGIPSGPAAPKSDCIATELPGWATATAREKRDLLGPARPRR